MSVLGRGVRATFSVVNVRGVWFHSRVRGLPEDVPRHGLVEAFILEHAGACGRATQSVRMVRSNYDVLVDAWDP